MGTDGIANARRPGRAVFVGERVAPELDSVRAALNADFPACDVQSVHSVDRLRELLDIECRHPDLVVIFQRSPGEYSRRDVDRLLTLVPLARIICAYGPWCESDGRSGTPWPPGTRVALAEAAPRLQRELSVLCGGSLPLPWTATRGETFEYDHAPAIRGDSIQSELAALRRLTLVSRGPDPVLVAWIAAVFRRAGCRCLPDRRWTPGEPSPAAVVWDLDPLDDRVFEDVRRYCREHASVVVGLAGLPCEHDRQRLVESGVAAVLRKPTPSEPLLQAVAKALSTAEPAAAPADGPQPR